MQRTTLRAAADAIVRRTDEEASRTMKKRLRKKQRVGEFRQMGFEVRFKVRDVVPDSRLDAFWDTFIGEAVEASGLVCAGGCGREWDLFVTPAGRATATDRHRATVEAWLRDRNDVEQIEIGDLQDAW